MLLKSRVPIPVKFGTVYTLYIGLLFMKKCTELDSVKRLSSFFCHMANVFVITSRSFNRCSAFTVSNSSRSIVYEVLDVANYKLIPHVTSSYPFHEGRGVLAS